MIERSELKLTEEDHDKAFTEISFLLEILGRTMDDLVGKSAPSLAVNAGRHMGRRLPLRLEDDEPDTIVNALGKHLHEGFAITSDWDGERNMTLNVDGCAIREVCKNRNLEVGGALCKTYHYYFAGMFAQLSGRQARPTTAAAGDNCEIKLQIGPKKN